MTAKRSNDFESILQEAITNIRDDRDRSLGVLNELQNWIKQSSDRLGPNAMSMAKLLEVCQKSNEQLVKLADLKGKRQSDEVVNLTDEEREKLYEDASKFDRDE